MEQDCLHRPAVETALRSGTNEEEKASAHAREATPPAAPRKGWRLFPALLQLRAFRALHHREFRLIWYGHIFASLGVWMDQVTRGWLIYELTDSALQLGLVRGVQAIPLFFLSPVAGTAADRYSRKMQVVSSQVVIGLVFAVTALLVFTGAIEPWHVYATAFLMAVAQAFLQPARAAMISDAVPAENLTNAIGLNAVLFNVARSTGPALAGVLIAIYGTGGSYAVQAGFFLLATVWTVQISSSLSATRRSAGQSALGDSFAQSMIDGWRFSWRNETVRAALFVAMFASLFISPFTTLLPVFARDILGVGARGQGLLLTSMGVGALCSSVLIASFGDRLPRGLVMLAGVTSYGLAVVVFALSPWFELSMLLMGITGLCHVYSHALVQTIIQSYSPSEFRGRTIALFHMNQVVMTIGAMLVGALSSVITAPWAVALMGVGGALTMIAISVGIPAAKRIQ